MRDERAAPLFCYLVRHLDREGIPQRLSSAHRRARRASAAPDAVEALKDALQQRRLAGAAPDAAHPGRRRAGAAADRHAARRSTALRDAVDARVRAACASAARAELTRLGAEVTMSNDLSTAASRSTKNCCGGSPSGVRNGAALRRRTIRSSARNIDGLLDGAQGAAPAAAVHRRRHRRQRSGRRRHADARRPARRWPS